MHARTLTDGLADYFTALPEVWIDGMELARIAGQYAWRSRVSDCRKRGMVIQNKQITIKRADGTRYTISQYRYLPAREAQESVA